MFEKLLKYKLVDRDLKVSDLSRLINTSHQNLTQKLKRDNFSEKEMIQIAEALNCDLEITLIDKPKP